MNNFVNKINRRTIIAIIVTLAMIFGVSYAYFSSGNTGNATYVTEVETGLDITYLLSTESNLTLDVDPSKLQETGSEYVESSISTPYASLANDSDYENVICHYEIYYTPTTVYHNSSNNTDNETEMAIVGTDSTNNNASFEFNLNGVSSKTKMADAYISASNDGTAVVDNWTFGLRHYNTSFNQTDTVGSSYGGNITFKAVMCYEDKKLLDKTSKMASVGTTVTETLSQSGATCSSTNTSIATVSQSGTTLTINKIADGDAMIKCSTSKKDLTVYKITSSVPANNYFIALSQTDTTNMATDTHGSYTNYRYVGANPDNYACLTSDCTQKFRVIGVFNEDTHGQSGEQLVKLITSDSLGNYYWDYKQTGVGSSSSDYGSNDWSDSQLMYMLNGYVASSNHLGYSYNQSTYYISDGTYNIYQLNNGNSYLTGNGATTLNKPAVTSTSGYSATTATIQTLTNAQANLIEEVTWHLGGIADYNSSTASDFYTSERGTMVYSGRPTTWIGKIGLMYPSDYGYATSGGSICSSTELYNWYDSSVSDCKTNDWLLYTGSTASSNGITTDQWTISPFSGYSNGVFEFFYYGNVYGGYAYSTGDGVRAAFYLKSTVSITDGDGSYDNPYILAIPTTVNDNSAPTVSNITTSSSSITATLTDNKNLSSYIVSTSETAPSSGYTEISGTNYNLTYTASESGTYYIYVKDIAGNVTKSSAITVTVDTSAPTITNIETSNSVITATLADETGLLEYIVSTSTSTPTSGYASISGTSYSLNYEISSEGTYYIYVKDISGNITKSSGIYFDKTAPVISNVNQNSNVLTGTLTDNNALAGYIINTSSVTPTSGWTEISGVSYNFSYTASTEGVYYIHVKDAFGNITNSEGYVLDSTSPVISNLNVTYKKVSATLTDNYALSGYIVSKSTSAPTSGWNEISGTSYGLTYTASESGTYYLYVKDVAGNVTKSSSFILDVTAPTIKNLETSYTGFTATLEDNNALSGYIITTSETAPASGYNSISGTSYNLTYNALATGTYYLYVKDAAGNITTSSQMYFDKTLPTITNIVTNGLSVSATLLDNYDLAGYVVSTSSSAPSSGWTNIEGTSYSLTTSVSTEGVYYIYLKDTAGNITKSSSLQLTIVTTSTYITNLSQTDTTNIATDTHGSYTNIRYVGANPNNYACLTSDCTQKFRIIGLFNEDTHGQSGEQLVKLITSNSLGSYYWDYKQTGVGSSDSDYGSNDWSDSQLMYMLNGYVASSNHSTYTYNSSTYYISDGTYNIYQLNNGNSYLTGNGATILNIPASVTTSLGYSATTATIQTLTNAQANLIEEVVWHLGAIENYHKTSSSSYSYERGTKTCYTAGNCSNARPSTWTGKIGLIYPSDYGYACNNCSNYGIFEILYECNDNNWLENSQFTISPDLIFSDGVSIIYAFSRNGITNIYPSFYIKSNVSVISGDGTYDNPFILAIPANADTTSPVITDESASGNTITASVSDERSLASYVVSTSTSAPSSGWVAISNAEKLCATDPETSSEVCSYNGSITYTASADGTYYIYVKDLAGNIAKSSAVVVDTTEPEISNIVATDLTVTATIFDEVGLDSYIVTTSSTAPSSGWINTSGTSQNITYTASNKNIYYIYVKDTSGNIAQSDNIVLNTPILASTIMSLGLTTDTHGTYTNYRYTGTNPDNYACLTSDCTQLFRIIGVFNDDTHEQNGQQLVKLITSEYTQITQFDYKRESVGSSKSYYGSNDWSDSQLMYMLNGYIASSNHSGYVLSGNNVLTSSSGYRIYTLNNGNSYLTGNGVTTLNLPSPVTTSSGYSANTGTVQTLTNDQANLIEEVTWHLGGTSSFTSTTTGLASNFYNYERGTSVYSGRPTTWTGKIGLMYPSDYGYATSDATCISSYYLAYSSSDTNSWANQSSCITNDWILYIGSTTSTLGEANYQWTITPNISASDYIFRIYQEGSLTYNTANGTIGVRASFYLTPNVVILNGTGTSDNPYIISENQTSISNLNASSATVTATITDTVGLSGYVVSTSETAPTSGYSSISGTSYNLSYTVNESGTYYLYVKDLVGNVIKSDAFTLDATPATIGTITQNGLTITTTLTDDLGLGSYALTSNNSVPTSGWTSISGTSYSLSTTAASNGVYYLYVKDAAGNVTKSSELLLIAKSSFDYTGGIQTYLVPKTGYYKLETWGAQGGYSLNNGTTTTAGGYGGYSTGEIYLTKGTTLYVVVGGKGTNGKKSTNVAGGYNGGGSGTWDNSDDESSGGGGGATHIATVTGLLSTLSSSQSNVLIVSGGGGGASWTYTPGSGGGMYGGYNATYTSSSYATQTSGYSFGKGQNASGTASSDGVGGGGGGWYGGYANNVYYKSSGTGGSGYIGNSDLFDKYMYCYNCTASSDASTKTISTTNVSATATTNYAKSGNGYAKITFISETISASQTIISSAASDSSIVTDTHGSYTNYRYTGANPDNYACLTEDCSQKFRIIGVFNEDTHGKSGQQLIKLITSDSLGDMRFDSKFFVGSTETTTVGSNDWTDSQLMYMLNGYVGSSNHSGYSYNSSTYYISDGTSNIYQLYNGKSYLTGNGSTTLNIPATANDEEGYSETTSTIQTLTSAQSNLIETVTWHLGGISDYSTTSTGLASNFYTAERGTNTCYSAGNCSKERLSTWTGKIGLMYPSDFGYATSNSICKSSYYLGYNSSDTNSWYNQSACGTNDWLLYTGSTASSNGTAAYQWTINSVLSDSSYVFSIYSDGVVYSDVAYYEDAVRPTFYLKSSVLITGGTGTYDDPYIFDSGLPSEYEEVEYLESTGTQSIDTNYYQTSNSRVKLKFAVTDTSQEAVYVMGAWNESDDIENRFAYLRLSEGNIVTSSTSSSYTNLVLGTIDTNIHTVEYNLNLSTNNIIFDDVVKGTYTYTNIGNNTEYGGVHLFAFGAGVGRMHSSAKIYSFKAWNGSQLVRNMVPCYRKSDNVAGMYDKVNGVFYTNSGTGSFILGPGV